MRLKKILFLSLGHIASDFYPGMLSPLLPVLTAKYGWSIARAGVLVMVMNIFMNGVQPLVGIMNDRSPKRWFLWAGPLVSAVPFSLLLFVGRFDVMLVLLAIAGFGVSMYHPVGAVAAGHIADEKRKGLSMALFSSGGTVGVTLAPLALVLIIDVLGERYMPLVALPAVIMAIYFLNERDVVVSEHRGLSFREMVDAVSASGFDLFIIWLIAAFRAIVYNLVNSFLPMLSIARGATYAQSAYFLSATMIAGLVGMFIGGHLSDVHGRRKVMAITMLLSSPMFLLFLRTTGPLSMGLLLLGMVLLTSTIPVNIILAQKSIPRMAGMASSLVMGGTFMMGGLAAPPFGALADRVGIETAFHVLCVFPLLGGLTVFLLRRE